MSHIELFYRLPRQANRLQHLLHVSARKRVYSATVPLNDTSSSALPRVARPAFWASLIPKPFRRRTSPNGESSHPRQPNPMTPFILLGILVGSNAINLIALRNEMLNFSRKTEAKLALLREVIQKVKNGEDVDVRRALGTGQPHEEAEWEEMMQELEQTDMLWEGRKKRDAKREERLRAQDEAEKKISEERARTREEWAKYREGLPDRLQQAQEPQQQQDQPKPEQEQRQRRPKFLM